MRNTFSRVLWVIAGVLLIIMGIISIADPTFAVGYLAFLIGISMLISGVVDIALYAKTHDYIAGAGWILADGILTVILALFILFNQLLTAVALPLVFGMWLIFTGVSRSISSFELKKLNVTGWGWFLALGILLIVVGFISFLEPVSAIFAIGVFVGVGLILEGVVAIFKGLFSQRFLL